MLVSKQSTVLELNFFGKWPKRTLITKSGHIQRDVMPTGGVFLGNKETEQALPNPLAVGGVPICTPLGGIGGIPGDWMPAVSCTLGIVYCGPECWCPGGSCCPEWGRDPTNLIGSARFDGCEPEK